MVFVINYKLFFLLPFGSFIICFSTPCMNPKCHFLLPFGSFLVGTVIKVFDGLGNAFYSLLGVSHLMISLHKYCREHYLSTPFWEFPGSPLALAPFINIAPAFYSLLGVSERIRRWRKRHSIILLFFLLPFGSFKGFIRFTLMLGFRIFLLPFGSFLIS